MSAGGTVAGRDATFTTSRTPAPSVAAGAVSAVSLTTATLNGTVNPHGVATQYYFEYGTKSPSARTATVSAGAGTATLPVSAPLSRLAPGTTYLYRLVAVGAEPVAGRRAPSPRPGSPRRSRCAAPPTRSPRAPA